MKVFGASRPGGGSRTARQSSCLEPGLTGGCGADRGTPVCCDGRRGTRQKGRRLVILAASLQEVFADEIADEARSSGEAQPPGQRDGSGDWRTNAHGHGAMSESMHGLCTVEARSQERKWK
jgi:hypothetical protein